MSTEILINVYCVKFKSKIENVNFEILNLKLVVLLEYQNIKILLQRVTPQIGLRKFLWLKKLKILCHGYML